jgi:glycosyltransferase involved in cell wall biosynthesis
VTGGIFLAYRDSPERRAALAAEVGTPERYRLFGLDELLARGADVSHNLRRDRPPRWARLLDGALNRLLYGAGGYGGDFAGVLQSLRSLNGSGVVFATVDTVGIPLVLLKRFGLVRRPIVYVGVGLPERLVQLRNRPMRGLFRRSLRDTAALVVHAESEADWLREWLGPGSPVVFVPFGVDVRVFAPAAGVEEDVDVVSVGADPRRDFDLLLDVARRQRQVTFRIVATAERARTLPALPPNVTVETDISVEQVRDRLARAAVVALPVRDNTYSGATTTLLQAMAMAKPVVVSRTAAIARGYGLEDGVNCRFVEPGDVDGLEQALLETLTGADAACSLGIRARETVERSLTWERYVDALWKLLSRS